MKLNLHSIASPRCGTRRHSAQQRSRAPAQVASTTAIDEGHLRPVHRPNRDSSHRLLFPVVQDPPKDACRSARARERHAQAASARCALWARAAAPEQHEITAMLNNTSLTGRRGRRVR